MLPWWSWVGAVSGAGIGFIIANVPGLMVGAVAGNRLGAIRDAKGRSVAAVFSQLGGNQKAEVSSLSRTSPFTRLTSRSLQILKMLAMKVLGSAL